MLALELVGFFLFILVLGYLLPAGYFYYAYWVRQSEHTRQLRIQQREPTRGQIRREIRMSVVAIMVFAVMATGVFQLYKGGKTAIYLNIHDYPLWYLPVSVLLCMLIHDTYFYWTHRFMHWRPAFKYFHVGHHRSITPTPWSIYAFQPLEAATQFFGICLLVVFLPLHPWALLAFLWYDTMVNTAGHTGYEVVPKPVARSWFYKGFNTVTHHDAHHTNMRVNFGLFFNVWDRLMGTFLDESTPKSHNTAPHAPIQHATGRRLAASAQRNSPWAGLSGGAGISERDIPGRCSGNRRRSTGRPAS